MLEIAKIFAIGIVVAGVIVVGGKTVKDVMENVKEFNININTVPGGPSININSKSMIYLPSKY